MPNPSPTRAGLRRAWRNPRAVFCEIAWRWSFGVAALAIVAVAALRAMGTVTVGEGDLRALRGSDRTLAVLALAHIWQKTSGPLLWALAITIPVLSLIWVLAASLGRGRTLELMFPGNGGLGPNRAGVFGLHWLRVLWMLAAIAGTLAAVVFASLVANQFSSDEEPNYALYLLLISLLLPAIALGWGTMNWYLSLAPIFSVRRGSSAWSAMREAREAVRTQRGAFVTVSTAYGFPRLILLLLLISVTAGAAALAYGQGGEAAAWIIATVFTLCYFAAADFLYLARVASYAEICFPRAEPTEACKDNAMPLEAAPAATDPQAANLS